MALSATTGIAIEWICVILAFLFVLMRLWVRWRMNWQGTTRLSDAFIVFGLLLFIGVTCCDTENYRIGLWSTNQHFGADGPGEEANKRVSSQNRLIVVYKLFYSAGPLFYVSLWCVKAALLVFYYGLIPVTMRKYRMVTHAVTAFVAATFIIMLLLNFLYCFPVRLNWELDESKACYAWPAKVPYYTTLALHYATDLCILVLPFPILRYVTLSHQDKIGVGVMFGLGMFTIVSATTRTVCLGESEFNIPAIGAWSAVEMSTGIMVTCCPSLKWLYRSAKNRKMSVSHATGDTMPSARRASAVVESVRWPRAVPTGTQSAEDVKWNWMDVERVGTSESKE